MSPRELASLIIDVNSTMRDAMAAIDRGARQIALVADSDGRLVGTVTDGDVRRALLRGLPVEEPVVSLMRGDFVAMRSEAGHLAARQLMQTRKLHQMPILDPNGRPSDLIHIDDLSGAVERDTMIVLMAGGLGTRLRPLTENIPKPMLPIGGKPILEKIIQQLVTQGFHQFTICLNYKGEMIREYFGDGSGFGAQIEYVDEKEKLGTAGALSLLPSRPELPFVVMNADLLTTLQFDAVLRFHNETEALATMCAREFSVQVPYGVLEVHETRLRSIVEKPTHTHFVNAGIYVLSPEILDQMVSGEAIDMPTLFERAIAQGMVASVFPLQEYWIDIGRMEDLERARANVSTDFQE